MALAVIAGLGAWWLAPTFVTAQRLPRLRAFFENPAAHAERTFAAGQRCGDAPFSWPTTGYLGFGYGDSWSLGHRHTGFDIFGPAGLNETPVYAAYPGFLTRKPDWKSTVIIRVPQDPLDPARQIWTYYTHLAGPNGDSYIARDFPPGTEEAFVEAGTLLGHQGNFSGEAGNPVGIHLHFSIVRDDGAGDFRNEARPENTLDPSPYLGVRASVFDDWTLPVPCTTT